MTIAIDTSVWIAFLRGSDLRVIRAVQRLLDEDVVVLPIPVKVELLSGAMARDRKNLASLFSALPQLYPSLGTWGKIEALVERAGQRGLRFGLGDLLIGALASEAEALVWSLDEDFTRLAKLGFVTLHPGARSSADLQ